MKVSLNWIKDFVEINDTPQNIADKLTLAGMEVEEIIYQDRFIDHVRVGRIREIKQHPNADKLTVCRVDIGEEDVQIITSATNIRENDLVPVSLPGAHLANGIEIKKSQMRGVDSDGMFCSGEELGIGDDIYEGASINGILVFREDIKEGTMVADVLGLNDVVFDVNITANRPDCNSIIGVAKELSAIYRVPFKTEDLSFKVSSSNNANDLVTVDVQSEACPRYMAAVVENVKIKPSPKWMAARLNAVGIKSINTIVDITNYVLIEYGQPMHAFDKNMVGGDTLVIRQANEEEKITCLDGGTYELSKDDLVVCDNNHPMAIAGVIGGTNSCIEKDTKTIVFESACFERKSVRVTSRKLGIRTDSSARFERGVDIASPNLGLKKALKLINLLEAGDITTGLIDNCSQTIESRKVVASFKKIESVLGVTIPNDQILSILNGLQIKSQINGDELTCVVTPERFDIECANDIAEELIRFYGYDVYNNMDKKALSETEFTIGKNDAVLAEYNALGKTMVDLGFYQAINYSMAPINHAENLGISSQDMVVISNPLSAELAVMRLSLAHGLLTNVQTNLNRSNQTVRLFEFGRTYHKTTEDYSSLPNEKNMLAFVSNEAGDDFYTFKGVVEALLKNYQLATRLNRSALPYLHPGKSSDIIDLQSKMVLASFGEIHPKVAAIYGLNKVMYAQINVDILSNRTARKIVTKAISKFPTVERDLAVIVGETVQIADIEATVRKSCGGLCDGVEVFDIYRSSSLGDGLKSVAFKFKLTSYEKTLTDTETNQIVEKILGDLKIKCGAKLR